MKPRKSMRAAAIVPALICISAVLSAAFAAGAISVRVQERTEVAGDQLLLGQIARIDGADPAALRPLQNLALGRAPLPGKSRTLDAAFLQQRFKQGGIDLAGLDLQVPPEIVVTRRAVEIGRERVEQIVKAFIQQQGAGKAETVRVKEIRLGEPILLPPGRMTCDVSVPKHTVLSGAVPLSILFKVDEEFEKRVYVTALIEARAAALVSLRPLGRFKPIEEGDVEVRLVDLSDLPADYLSEPEQVVGKRVRRALDSNTVLRPDLIESLPAVKRGDRVVIVAESNGLRVTAVGQAKQKGAAGERIPVVNLDSNRVVHARVIDGQTVKIDF